MKYVSWNVNGLRACMGKGFTDFFEKAGADIFCLQEHKASPDMVDLPLPGYEQYWCCAQKKGYSGTAVFTKEKPLNVTYELPREEFATEGRVITLEFADYFFVTCYTPNSQRELARLEYRMRWEEALREYLSGLDGKKPVILCGDLNVAHTEMDIKNPSSNRKNAGFTPQERACFTALLQAGFVDTYRHLNPDKTGAYTWWSYMFNARANNVGWRIDYFVVSRSLLPRLKDAMIYPEVMGSDHCPVGMELV